MKAIYASILISFLALPLMQAQQDPNYTFYGFNMNLFNPAFAGQSDEAELVLGMRSQWAGVDGAPQSQSVVFSAPMGNKVGLGVSVLNDQTFIENQTWVAFDFSYHIQLSERNRLYFGLKASANTYNANTQGLVTYGFGQDGTLLDFESRFTPNVGVGLLLKNESYFVSVSVPKLLAQDRLQQQNGNAFLGSDRVHAYLAGGYDFEFSETTRLRAMGMLRYVDAAPLSYELTGILGFHRKFDLGLSYRIDEAVSGLFLLNLSQGFRVGYAYESSLQGPIDGLDSGTHELMMQLQL